jgi:Alginate lyase
LTSKLFQLDRRRFCMGAATLSVFAQSSLLHGEENGTYAMVASVDRQRILDAAKRYVMQPVQTITAFPTKRSPGGLHDFFSQADYFWPDPKDPNGPYINRDGQSNPENFNDHRKAMSRLSVEMPALTSAWLLLRGTHAEQARSFGERAADHLRAWFIAPETRMNPNLEFSQGVHGVSTGRNYGIIDTLHLVEVARAASLLSPEYLTAMEQIALLAWFRDYLHWMMTSEKGMKERDLANNHSTCWALQAAEYARLVGDEGTCDELRTRYETVLVPKQFGLDGSFPLELARTKPYSYSIFNFDVMAALCQSLDLFSFNLPDGRGICKAASFLFPYLKDKGRWPYAHDVEHFDAWPVRSPGLLFCGVSCKRPEYVQLWRTLNPDPADPEIIRSYPIRQPLLWLSHSQ